MADVSRFVPSSSLVSLYPVVAVRLFSLWLLFARAAGLSLHLLCGVTSDLRSSYTMRAKYAISDAFVRDCVFAYCPSVAQYVYSLSAENCFRLRNNAISDERVRDCALSTHSVFRPLLRRTGAGLPGLPRWVWSMVWVCCVGGQDGDVWLCSVQITPFAP